MKQREEPFSESAPCACINPFLGRRDYRDGEPSSTCKGRVVTGLNFCYVEPHADCRDKTAALGGGRFYSELACKAGLVPRSGFAGVTG